MDPNAGHKAEMLNNAFLCNVLRVLKATSGLWQTSFATKVEADFVVSFQCMELLRQGGHYMAGTICSLDRHVALK